MGAGCDKFQQVTLARAVSAYNADETYAVLELDFNVFKIPPFTDFDISDSHCLGPLSRTIGLPKIPSLPRPWCG
jgi:hypothetical protein